MVVRVSATAAEGGGWGFKGSLFTLYVGKCKCRAEKKQRTRCKGWKDGERWKEGGDWRLTEGEGNGDSKTTRCKVEEE